MTRRGTRDRPCLANKPDVGIGRNPLRRPQVYFCERPDELNLHCFPAPFSRRCADAIIVAFRKHTPLPLDDCLYALQATIPQLTRSSLHRRLSATASRGCRMSKTARSRSASSRHIPSGASISPKFAARRGGSISSWPSTGLQSSPSQRCTRSHNGRRERRNRLVPQASCGQSCQHVSAPMLAIDTDSSKSFYSNGTGGRDRTDTLSPEQDFESSASTSSATPAYCRRELISRYAPILHPRWLRPQLVACSTPF